MNKSYIGKNARLASMVVLDKSKPRNAFELNVDIENTLDIKMKKTNFKKLRRTTMAKR